MSAWDIVVTINGTDRTKFTNRYECAVDQNGDGATDVCTLMVRGFTPTVGMEVSIVQGGTVTLFDGQITDLELVQRRNGTRKRYRCQCSDWTFLLDRRLVSGSWTATASNTIVGSIISSFTSGFTTTNVQGSLTAVDFSAFLEPASQALKRLADSIGAVFKVRYDKDIYFRTTSNISNPATLDASNLTYKNLSYHQNIDQIRNRVYVQGAGTNCPVAVPVGKTTIAVNSTALFSAAGGKASCGSNLLTYTGCSVDNQPVTAPVGTLNVGANAGAGSVPSNTTFSYKITWVTPAGESLASAVSANVTTGAGPYSIDITFFPTVGSVPSNVTNCTVYRSTAASAGAGPWKARVAVVPMTQFAANGTHFTVTDTAAADGTTAEPSVSTAGTVPITGSTTSGSTAIGATTVGVSKLENFNHGGGIAVVTVAGSPFPIIYTSNSVTPYGAGSLTGVPASGYGSVLATIPISTPITNVSVLTGIPSAGAGSIATAINTGDALNILVQRDDAASQTAIAAVEGGDGIHEFAVSNPNLQSIAACNTYGDAELNLGKNIQESATYVSEDSATVPGASAVINIAGISTTIPIAHVAISWMVGRKNPQRAVTATSQFKTLSQYLADLQKLSSAA